MSERKKKGGGGEVACLRRVSRFCFFVLFTNEFDWGVNYHCNPVIF